MVVAGTMSGSWLQLARRVVDMEVAVWDPCSEDYSSVLMEGVELGWGHEE